MNEVIVVVVVVAEEAAAADDATPPIRQPNKLPKGIPNHWSLPLVPPGQGSWTHMAIIMPSSQIWFSAITCNMWLHYKFGPLGSALFFGT